MLISIFKKYNLYCLLAALLAISLARLMLHWHQNQPSVDIDVKHQKYIQENIWQEIKTLERESREVEQLFQEGNAISLIEIKKKHQYPCLVFNNAELVFWSDARLVPTHNELAGTYRIKFVEIKNKKLLVHREFFRTAEGRAIEIFTYLPIYEGFKIENTYLQSRYNPLIIPPKVELSSKRNQKNAIYATDGTFLFAVEKTNIQELSTTYWLWLHLFFDALSLVFLFIFIWRWRNWFVRNRVYELHSAILLGFLFFVRWLMLSKQIPFQYFEWNLFNPQLYASSFWAPSLGDLWLNILVVFIFLQQLQRYYPYTWIFTVFSKMPAKYFIFAGFLIILLNYHIFYEFFFFFSSIFTDSQLVLDISKNISFSYVHWFAYLIFIFLSVIFFLATQILSRLLIRFFEEKYLYFFIAFILATLLHSAWAYSTGSFHPILSLLNGFYLLILYFFNFPKYLFRFNYYATLYLFFSGLVCSVVGVYAMIFFGQKTQDIQMQKYAEALLEERDFSAEYSLDNLLEDIRLDAGVRNYFKNPFLDKSLARRKIEKLYIKNEFPDYQVDIFLFDAFGYSLQPHTSKQPYQEWVNLYQKPEFRTDKADRFFINETQAIEQKIGVNLLRMYVDFLEIRQDNVILGYIVFELKKKKNEDFKVYPELLQNERFREPKEFRNFSYGIFSNNKLIYRQGIFNYERNFKETLFKINILFEKGYVYKGYQHFALKGEKGRTVVVSAPIYAFKYIFTNFSFFFLLLLFLVTQVLLIYGINSFRKKINVSYIARVQLILNIAFFLPLVVVSVTILSILSSSYDKDLNDYFLQKAQNAARTLINPIQQYKNQLIEKDELLKEINAIADFAQADINLFAADGKLISSSQTAIYDSQILSKYINTEALWKIMVLKEQNILLAEQIGSLAYKSVYFGIRSYDNNELLAILSVPFFDFEDERQKKIADGVSTIINIFTIVFIVFVVISYLTSHILTEPFRLITQKIRKTTLYAYNEPIHWESDDEIGLMISEYNKMLLNLEQSKEILAQTEKETAWREMAKQVAHEIKNPLTPMKLTLQHLQMRIQKENPDLQKLTEKPFETLLTQIDLLSDIATSFSTFAKMAIPKNEIFDITEVLRQTLLLYESDKNIQLIRTIQKGNFEVKGDKQLFSQIFTNLILNAIQAVPNLRKPEISVSLYQQESFVRIEIRDNGTGIPEDIKQKVFLPNFSTKFTGSGIGLALAKRGIEHAGGKIWFETEKDVGTCFFIEMPIQ
ncbi:MAG: HAMP domain-containing sensor histidine kinase [Thermonemataceae bacterium]|nr:HAMP domain-containing sensor histidine kinase [Thermonemataceae bacterium]